MPFPLIADTEKLVCNLYGVWGEKKFFLRNAQSAKIVAVGLPDIGHGGKLAVENGKEEAFGKGKGLSSEQMRVAAED